MKTPRKFIQCNNNNAIILFQCCQQYCLALLNVEPELTCSEVGRTILNNVVDNIKQCALQNISQCIFNKP